MSYFDKEKKEEPLFSEFVDSNWVICKEVLFYDCPGTQDMQMQEWTPKCSNVFEVIENDIVRIERFCEICGAEVYLEDIEPRKKYFLEPQWSEIFKETKLRFKEFNFKLKEQESNLFDVQTSTGSFLVLFPDFLLTPLFSIMSEDFGPTRLYIWHDLPIFYSDKPWIKHLDIFHFWTICKQGKESDLIDLSNISPPPNILRYCTEVQDYLDSLGDVGLEKFSRDFLRHVRNKEAVFFNFKKQLSEWHKHPLGQMIVRIGGPGIHDIHTINLLSWLDPLFLSDTRAESKFTSTPYKGSLSVNDIDQMIGQSQSKPAILFTNYERFSGTSLQRLQGYINEGKYKYTIFFREILTLLISVLQYKVKL